MTLSIFNISRVVTSAQWPDLAEPPLWAVGQAVRLLDIPSFPQGDRCDLWAPQEAWALWRVTRLSSTYVLAWGTSPRGPLSGAGSSRAGS